MLLVTPETTPISTAGTARHFGGVDLWYCCGSVVANYVMINDEAFGIVP